MSRYPEQTVAFFIHRTASASFWSPDACGTALPFSFLPVRRAASKMATQRAAWISPSKEYIYFYDDRGLII